MSEPLIVAGRYELGERLGHGGMAEVRAATDRRLGRTVAVKRLRADLAEQPTARRRFEAEARTAARLSHPNIVAVYDSGEDDGVPFLVMERLPGRTLAHEIAAGPLGVERAVDVTRAVLSALSAAHSAGIVHRDVKPSNVLLTDDGLAKVSDFGIAKTAEESVATATLTGELLATPAYLAPERLAGAQATPSSDLYAVGVLLYEALSGKRPFRGETPMVVLDAVKRGNAEPLSQLRPGLPDSLGAVVERAMASDPAARFGSADEMAAALDAQPVSEDETIPLTTVDATATLAFSPPARDGHTEVVPAELVPPRAHARAARRWAAVGVGVVITAAVAVGIAVSRDTGGQGVTDVPPTTVTPIATQPPSTSSPLPQPLDRAIDQLEQSVSR